MVSVVVIEDREQGAIHRSSVGEDAHRSGAPCDFEKAQLHSIGGSDGSATKPWAQGFVAPTSEGFTGRGFGYQRAVNTRRPLPQPQPLAPQNRSDHFAVRSKELDHFGQACEAEANGSASVPAPASWRREGRKRSSTHLAVLRSVVSNPSVNRS